MLGLIDDPITKELEESQSKLIRVRWTGFVAGEYESSLCLQKWPHHCEPSELAADRQSCHR